MFDDLGGQSITIAGKNLLNDLNDGGLEIEPTTIQMGSNSVSTLCGDTQCTFNDPPGAPGTVDVVVKTLYGTSTTSSADQFTYYGQPTVTAVTPADGPANGGTTIAITGTNLSSAANITSLTVDSVTATNFSCSNATTCTADTPKAPSGGPVDVVVRTPGGKSVTSAADAFTYVSPPTLGAATAGPIAARSTTLNATVNPNRGDTSVSFEYGSVAGNYSQTGLCRTSLMPGTTATPEACPVTGLNLATKYYFDVQASNLGGSATPATGFFTTSPDKPTVAATSPTKVATDSAELDGTVNPEGAATQFSFALTPKSGTVSSGLCQQSLVAGTTATPVTCVVPALQPATSYTYTITATNAVDTTTATSATFTTLTPAPTGTAVSPTSGTTTGGTPLTITGTDLSGATGITVGSKPATAVTCASAAVCTATTPAGTAGKVDVVVTTPAGTSATSSADKFTYASTPSGGTSGTPASGSGTPAAGSGSSASTGSGSGSSGGHGLPRSIPAGQLPVAHQGGPSLPGGGPGPLRLGHPRPGSSDAVGWRPRWAAPGRPLRT